MELIKDGAKLDTFIKGIKSRAAKLDNDIQQAAESAAWHFGVRENDKGELIGDVGYINRLYLSMGKGARHVAMTAWLTSFAGVSANTGPNKDTTPFIKDKSKVVDLEEGAKTKWFDMKPSKKPDEVVDLLKLTLLLIKKASGDKEVVHGAMLAELQALAEKYGNEGDQEEILEAENDE